MNAATARRARAAVARVSDSIAAMVLGQKLGLINGVITATSSSQVTATIAGQSVSMTFLGAQPPNGAAVKVLLVDGSPICLGVWPGLPIT